MCACLPSINFHLTLLWPVWSIIDNNELSANHRHFKMNLPIFLPTAWKNWDNWVSAGFSAHWWGFEKENKSKHNMLIVWFRSHANSDVKQTNVIFPSAGGTAAGWYGSGEARVIRSEPPAWTRPPGRGGVVRWKGRGSQILHLFLSSASSHFSNRF